MFIHIVRVGLLCPTRFRRKSLKTLLELPMKLGGGRSAIAPCRRRAPEFETSATKVVALQRIQHIPATGTTSGFGWAAWALARLTPPRPGVGLRSDRNSQVGRIISWHPVTRILCPHTARRCLAAHALEFTMKARICEGDTKVRQLTLCRPTGRCGMAGVHGHGAECWAYGRVRWAVPLLRTHTRR